MECHFALKKIVICLVFIAITAYIPFFGWTSVLALLELRLPNGFT